MRALPAFLLCMLLAGSALAADHSTLAPTGVCVFGNNPALTWTSADIVEGNESFAVPVLAEQTDCGCAVGFQMEAVHMSLYFGPEDVPVTVGASASLLAMTPGQPGACSVPGEELYESPSRSFNITTAGVHTFTLPLDLETSPCASFGLEYGVVVNLLSRFDNLPGVVSTREFPDYCRAYVRQGGIWTDVAQFSVSPLALYADIVCCSPVVPGEEKVWGSVKSMYR